MSDVSLHGETPGHGLAADLLVSLRPDQWTKNLIVFAGLVFGGQLLEPSAVARAGGTFGIFCALSSAMYLVNDVGDRARDRRHPVKATRPIAAGRVSPAVALGTAGLLIAGGAALAFLLAPRLALLALVFVGLLILYSRVLKQVVILDVLVIAIGFVLRAVAGAVVLDVPISQWLLVCTLLLALFLALTKRRQEIGVLGAEAMQHRPALGHYSPQILDQLVTIVAAATLVSYAVYTTGAETLEKFGTDLVWGRAPRKDAAEWGFGVPRGAPAWSSGRSPD
ncbi:MAG: decaprenyl-phosphate phosphoribosyltransferase [Acidobacteria bacterium]|jgi:4-hydroxybenzoate polyprenyltransferase|nr:decaprenyl-phosphate phosphoribosyltransferase [Acidobacteriota bacterium]MDP7338968.1 decaprenyl-phosphate phosphoribosyltransferase [Vicinamibacterales bacterium]MDP7478805.1 decaprenyl-phosphate phosphoribosyltransferase [Vicinamibacterales bacterium]